MLPNAKFVFSDVQGNSSSTPKIPTSDTDTHHSDGEGKPVTDDENQPPLSDHNKRKNNKGHNGPKNKDFCSRRQGQDTNVQTQNGGWKTASRKWNRSSSKDRKSQLNTKKSTDWEQNSDPSKTAKSRLDPFGSRKGTDKGVS